MLPIKKGKAHLHGPYVPNTPLQVLLIPGSTPSKSQWLVDRSTPYFLQHSWGKIKRLIRKTRQQTRSHCLEETWRWKDIGRVCRNSIGTYLDRSRVKICGIFSTLRQQSFYTRKLNNVHPLLATHYAVRWKLTKYKSGNRDGFLCVLLIILRSYICFLFMCSV